MKTPSSLPTRARETGKRKWSGTKDTCPECIRDTDIVPRVETWGKRERVPSITRNATTHTRWRKRGKRKGKGKGKEERSPRCRRRRRGATPFRRFAPDPPERSWRYDDGTATRRTETEGESDQPQHPGFRCIPLWKCDLARVS